MPEYIRLARLELDGRNADADVHEEDMALYDTHRGFDSCVSERERTKGLIQNWNETPIHGFDIYAIVTRKTIIPV